MAAFRDFHVKSNNFAKSQTSDIYIFLVFLKLNNGCKSCFNQKNWTGHQIKAKKQKLIEFLYGILLLKSQILSYTSGITGNH